MVEGVGFGWGLPGWMVRSMGARGVDRDGHHRFGSVRQGWVHASKRYEDVDAMSFVDRNLLHSHSVTEKLKVEYRSIPSSKAKSRVLRYVRCLTNAT